METFHVVVIGGGISGLAAAHEVRTLRPDVRVTVLEAAPVIGGKLALADVAGLSVDVGAESILARRPEAVELVDAVGLADDICHPATTSAAIWTRGALRPMPPTVMGVPADLEALARSGIVTRTGLASARLRSAVPLRRVVGDASVGDFVAQRLGPQVRDRLVEPLLGGVYAGHCAELSLTSAAPQIAELASRGGSLLRAAAAVRARRSTADPPVFAGIVGGVGRLPQAVADNSGAVVRTSSAVRELHRTANGWRVVIGSTHDPEAIDADAVVVAVPAPPASRLLAAVAPAAATALRRIDYASMAIITIVVPGTAVPDPLPGSGFLVPPVDGKVVKASTFSSAKWGWLGESAGETLVLRASVGRYREEALLQRTDAELVDLAVADLGEAIGLQGRLLGAHVQRWGGALPQYTVGHRQRVSAIRSAIDAVAGLAVCGAAYDGIGIAACVADGQRAARALMAALPLRPPPRPLPRPLPRDPTL